MTVYISSEAQRKLTINQLAIAESLGKHEINTYKSFGLTETKDCTVGINGRYSISIVTSYCEIQDDVISLIEIAK